MCTLVLKFGGAAVKNIQGFSNAAKIILDRKRDASHVVVVVSAMGSSTDHLIDLAKKVNESPPKREYDMLLSVGERMSMSLLAMALHAQGQEAVSLTGSQTGIITTEDHSDARIVDVRPHRLLKHLDRGQIVIVAGFQGMSVQKEITTLGRGGSDTTAVALGVALHADFVEFYKDVAGIYRQDPKVYKSASFCEKLTYEEALQCSGKALHARSLRLAKTNAVPLRVSSFQDFFNPQYPGTTIFSKKAKPSLPIYEKVST